jgi:coenzyme PQQ synthesis protein D (PqqD)
MSVAAVRISPTARASFSADGLVLLDVDCGLVLASNPVGARIWQLIEQRCAAADIARRLADEYAIPIERARIDVDAFVDALVARGLVIVEHTC